MKITAKITRAMMPFLARDEQIDLSSLLIARLRPVIAPHAPDGVLRGLADRYYIRPEASLNSLQGLFKVESLDRRELTFKALAGLIGGAIGWLPVELSSHNSHLGQVSTEWSVVAYYFTSALAAGMIGGMITRVQGAQIRGPAPTQQKVCSGLS